MVFKNFNEFLNKIGTFFTKKMIFSVSNELKNIYFINIIYKKGTL